MNKLWIFITVTLSLIISSLFLSIQCPVRLYGWRHNEKKKYEEAGTGTGASFVKPVESETVRDRRAMAPDRSESVLPPERTPC